MGTCIQRKSLKFPNLARFSYTRNLIEFKFLILLLGFLSIPKTKSFGRTTCPKVRDLKEFILYTGLVSFLSSFINVENFKKCIHLRIQPYKYDGGGGIIIIIIIIILLQQHYNRFYERTHKVDQTYGHKK